MYTYECFNFVIILISVHKSGCCCYVNSICYNIVLEIQQSIYTEKSKRKVWISKKMA